MARLLARRTALIHRLRFPTPHPMTMPNPALSDRAMPSRQLFRPQILSAFSRDVTGGGPQGNQPDGIADLVGGCTHPVITEICASNHGSLLDEDGNSFDWIEIYNPTAATVDLEGWQLVCTTPSKTTSWTFPASLGVVASGAYFIVYAADASSLNPAHPLRTNLKLSASGGTVKLKNRGGVVQDECGFAAPLAWGGSGADWSFGLGAALNGTLMQGYFLQTTPGTHNDTNCYGTRCQSPVVEIWRGLPGGAQSSLLSTGHGVWISELPNPNDAMPDDYYARLSTPSAGAVSGERVHYTVNATPPTAWSQFTTGSTPAVVPLTGSTVIRAFTAHEGDCQSEPLTVSVLFRASVLAPQTRPAAWPAHKDFSYYYDMDPTLTATHAAPQTMSPGVLDRGILAGSLTIPVVALTVPVPEMFDTTNGLVNRPSKADDDHASVPGSMEWFEPGSPQAAFSQAGSVTVGSHKFIVEFGHTPDDFGALQHALFPTSQTDRTQFDSIVLRRPNDPPLGYLKLCHDLWVNETHQAMGLYNPLSEPRGPGGGWHRRGCRPVHVFVNGLYWGLSHLTERIDNDFWATRLGFPKSFGQFEAGQNAGNVLAARQAVTAAHAAIPPLTTGMESHPLWIAIDKEVDVDELIDYLLLVWFNEDAPSDEQSCRAVRWAPQTGGYNDHAWRFFPSDPENLALSGQNPYLPLYGGTVADIWPPLDPLLAELLQIPLFKQHLRDRALHHLGTGGALSSTVCQARWDAIQTEIRKDLWAETARWSRQSASQVLDAWVDEMDTVHTHFVDRGPALLDNILDNTQP